MSRHVKAFTVSTLFFGLLGALFFAAVFAQLGFSGNLRDDLLFGASTGAVAGMLVAAIVGGTERQLMCRDKLADDALWTICDGLVGLFVGTAVATFVVLIGVSLFGYIMNPPGSAVWGALLGRLIGTPLGVILGLTIGVTWHWLHGRLAHSDRPRAA